MKILDCTLRDGGYYTNWDFEPELVKEYLTSVNSLPIEYVEVGYRQPTKSEYMGEYAYLPMHTIEQCKKCEEYNAVLEVFDDAITLAKEMDLIDKNKFNFVFKFKYLLLTK